MGHRSSIQQREELPFTDPPQSLVTNATAPPPCPHLPMQPDQPTASTAKSVVIKICMLKVEQPDKPTTTMTSQTTPDCNCWTTNDDDDIQSTLHTKSHHQRCTIAVTSSALHHNRRPSYTIATTTATIPIVHMSDITGEPNDDLNNANINCCDSSERRTDDHQDPANNNNPTGFDQMCYNPAHYNRGTLSHQPVATTKPICDTDNLHHANTFYVKRDSSPHRSSNDDEFEESLNVSIPFSDTNYKKTSLGSLDSLMVAPSEEAAKRSSLHENESAMRPISQQPHSHQPPTQLSLKPQGVASSYNSTAPIDRSMIEKLEMSESDDHCPACQQQQQQQQHPPQYRNSASKKSALAKRCCAKSHEPKETKVKKTTNWKLNCAKLISGAKSSSSSASSASTSTVVTNLPAQTSASFSDRCVCTSYRRMDAEPFATTVGSAEIALESSVSSKAPLTVNELLDIARLNPDEFPNVDFDKMARLQRARDIAQGVDPPPGYMPMSEVLVPKASNADSSDAQKSATVNPVLAFVPCVVLAMEQVRRLGLDEEPLKRFEQPHIKIHSQVDYIHCLVPDLEKITSSCFYWGKMDRYEAERLLEGKPEGTFLLRDSAQEEFLFSVSFRKYGRSLHARIEQFNHKFSFDCHDPAVSTSSSVTGLLEHYKNPQLVMFFEPALTLPLTRNFVFPLQQLCRATIVSHTTYDGIASLTLPATLKSYLKEYYYKQRVRVKRYD